jgi:hypothetical protein
VANAIFAAYQDTGGVAQGENGVVYKIPLAEIEGDWGPGMSAAGGR